MENCEFNDQAICMMCLGLKQSSSIKKLDLSKNEFGDEAAIEIA